ncbi:MFS transporter [Metasolibacillus meyeri]|uniref:MFS transporter n=1 Tax=Metasolibacillus meyeri TaxID=1071052 RepID=A0AAW9NNU7_9BACL|nr:MFS transporter [Metasolibacillus meyeri]MEC1180529.1 MFS transporter [Metasolibacillus meyeri]
MKNKKDFNFHKLWLGQSISLLGTQFTLVALPLFALEVLETSEANAALLRGIVFVPYLIFGLLAGALIDIFHRKKVLLICSICQGILLLLVFILTETTILTFPLLVFLMFLNGVFTTFHSIAIPSFLPEIITDKDNLKKGNAQLALSESLSIVIGPMLAGIVITLVGLTGSFTIDAVTYFICFLCVLFISRFTPHTEGSLKNVNIKSIYTNIYEGLIYFKKHPILEPIVSCGAIYGFFKYILTSILVIFLYKVMGLSELEIGFVVGSAAVGFLIGNTILVKKSRQFNNTKMLIYSATVSVIGLSLIPIMGYLGTVYGIVAASIIHGMGEGVFGPYAATIRQLASPSHMLGRVNSVQRTLNWGAWALGSFASAFLVSKFGLQATLFIGGFGTALCLIALVRRGILKGTDIEYTSSN